MIVPLRDAVTATTVYINPSYVVTLRPDPVDPDHISLVRLRDGESIRQIGEGSVNRRGVCIHGTVVLRGD